MPSIEGLDEPTTEAPGPSAKQIARSEFLSTVDVTPKGAEREGGNYDLRLLRRYCLVCRSTWNDTCRRLNHESQALDRPACSLCQLETPPYRVPEQPEALCVDCHVFGGAAQCRTSPASSRFAAQDRAHLRALARRADLFASWRPTPTPAGPPIAAGAPLSLTSTTKRDALTTLIETLGAPVTYKGAPVAPVEPSEGEGLNQTLWALLVDREAQAIAVEVYAVEGDLHGRILRDADVGVSWMGKPRSLIEVAASIQSGEMPEDAELRAPNSDALLYAALARYGGAPGEAHCLVWVLDASGAPGVLRSGWPLSNPRNTTGEFFKWALLRSPVEQERERNRRNAIKLQREQDRGDDVAGTLESTLAAWFASDEPSRRPVWWEASGADPRQGTTWFAQRRHRTNIGAMKSRVADELAGAVANPDMDVLGGQVNLAEYNDESGGETRGRGEKYAHELYVAIGKDSRGRTIVIPPSEGWDQSFKIHHAARRGAGTAHFRLRGEGDRTYWEADCLPGYSFRDPTGAAVLARIDDPLSEANLFERTDSRGVLGHLRADLDKLTIECLILDWLGLTQSEISARVGHSQQHVGRVIDSAHRKTVQFVTEL